MAKYDGAGVADNTMDVTVLGPALLAFGELHRAAYREALPGDERIPTVKVQEVNPGSFEVILSIDISWIEQAKSLLTKENVAYGAGIAGIVGFSLKDVVKAGFKAVRDRAAGNRRTRDELVNELGDLTLARIVDHLQDDKSFIRGCKGAISPLRKGNIDSLEFGGHDEGDRLELNQDDAEAINDLDDMTDPLIRTETIVVEVDTPHIRGRQKRKWRFYCDKYGTFTARMLDDEFAESIALGKVNFRNGLKFEVRLRIQEQELAEGEWDRSFEVITMRPADSDPPGEQTPIDYP